MNKTKQRSLIEENRNKHDSSTNYLELFYGKNARLKDFQNYQEIGNKVWYSGESAMLNGFFKRTKGNIAGFQPMQNGFWKEVRGDVSIVHVPIASSITETMSNVLFGRVPSILADTSNKTNNKKIDAKMQEIFDYMDLEKSLIQASQLESYSGTCAGKIILDNNFDHPIVQWFPAEFIEEHSKFGKVVEVLFKEKIFENEEEYLLKTICGYGYMRYELWYDDKVIPINSIDKTRGLKDLFFVDENGEPLNILTCIWKPNRVANNLFNSQKGDSDYSGLWNLFDSIDETASAMVDVIKKSRIYTFIPERMLGKDEYGNIGVNKAYGIDVWDVKKVAEQNEKLPQRDYVPINVSPYIESIQFMTKQCLNRVGLSPVTFGMDDSGANASGEALNIRDSRTEKTFKDKSHVWKRTLEELARLLLIFDYIQNANYLDRKDNSIVVPNKVVETKFNAVFPPYREISASDKFKQWIDMIDNGAMSVEYAMQQALDGEIPDADIELIKEQLGLGNEEVQEDVIEPTGVEDNQEE